MPTTKPIPHGRFVWYDLMTTDPSAAQKFYPAVTGWGTEKWKGPQPYTMWTLAEKPLGGVMNLPPGAAREMPPHWLPYVCVKDLDATAGKAKQLGGKVVHEPTDIPEVGRFAVIQDPQGAYLAIYTPSTEVPGHEGGADVGEFSWHELTTTDHNAAFDFYSKLFGWEKTNEHDMGEMGIYLEYGQNGESYGGMFTKTPDMPMPPNWLCYVRVTDVEKAVEVVKDKGGQVVNGPMEVPGGDWIAQCIDPQGGMFAVHHRKTAD